MIIYNNQLYRFSNTIYCFQIQNRNKNLKKSLAKLFHDALLLLLNRINYMLQISYFSSDFERFKTCFCSVPNINILFMQYSVFARYYNFVGVFAVLLMGYKIHQ